MTTKTSKPKTAKTTLTSTQLPWWKTGVIYQIYLRSFYDSNGDGVGDIPGVIEKLDYLSDLGVDAIWLSPVCKSTNYDWGYDISDYYSVEPSLGTMEDFDRLIVEAHRRNIKVIMDFVPNHTSTEHPWFQDALTSRNSEYRDFYIWRDPKPDGRPPNNWLAADFGGSAWEYHSPTGQFYLHNGWKQQADLNWRNPKVMEEFDKILRFWLDRGVSGFRLDVFNMLIKDAQFRDNPKSTKEDGPEIRLLNQRPLYNTSQPEVHEILKHWHALVAEYPGSGLLLGETNRVYDMDVQASFYGEQDEMGLVLNLAFVDAPLVAPVLRKLVEETEQAFGYDNWPVWTGSNHDKPRFPTRWARGNEAKSRAALLMMMALRGTPVLYYGDEFAMKDTFIAPWRLKDPRGKKYWPVDAGRDRSRTPMPWKNQVGAGFTHENVRPWLPYSDLKLHSVETQERMEDSTLQFTRDLIALRRDNVELREGRYNSIKTVDTVWAWTRGENTLVAINFSDHHHELTDIQGHIALSSIRSHDGATIEDVLHLDPWEAVIVDRAS